jgi:hypothetical protein
MTAKELRTAITALVIQMDRPPTSENVNRALDVMSDMFDDDPEGALMLLSLPRYPLSPSKEHPEKN